MLDRGWCLWQICSRLMALSEVWNFNLLCSEVLSKKDLDHFAVECIIEASGADHPSISTSRGRLFCSSPAGRPPAALPRLGSAQWRIGSNLLRCLRIPPARRCLLEIRREINKYRSLQLPLHQTWAGADAGTHHWLWCWPGQTSYELPSSAVPSRVDAGSYEHRCHWRWSSRHREPGRLQHLRLTWGPAKWWNQVNSVLCRAFYNSSFQKQSRTATRSHNSFMPSQYEEADSRRVAGWYNGNSGLVHTSTSIFLKL